MARVRLEAAAAAAAGPLQATACPTAIPTTFSSADRCLEATARCHPKKVAADPAAAPAPVPAPVPALAPVQVPVATRRCRTALHLFEETPPTTRAGRRATAAAPGHLKTGSTPLGSGGIQTRGTAPLGEEEEEDEGSRVGVAPAAPQEVAGRGAQGPKTTATCRHRGTGTTAARIRTAHRQGRSSEEDEEEEEDAG